MTNNEHQPVSFETAMLIPAAIVGFFSFLVGLIETVDVEPTLTAIVLCIGGVVAFAIALTKLYRRKCL